VLDAPHKWEWVLKRADVQDIWGVGKRLAQRLRHANIHTAWDLSTANPKIIRKMSNVNVERTIRELNGVSCIELEAVLPDKKQIYCTRSFGQKATDVVTLRKALVHYASRAAEKMRQQRYLATALHVFINTSPHQPNYHAASRAVQLPYPTDDTRDIVQAVSDCIETLFKEGHAYLKAGVGIIEMQPKTTHQFGLFDEGQSKQSGHLMAVIDQINQQHGRGSVFVAAQGNNPSRIWYMRQQYLSPQYTTKWGDIPIAKC
jgi:DNA polymerase V